MVVIQTHLTAFSLQQLILTQSPLTNSMSQAIKYQSHHPQDMQQ